MIHPNVLTFSPLSGACAEGLDVLRLFFEHIPRESNQSCHVTRDFLSISSSSLYVEYCDLLFISQLIAL